MCRSRCGWKGASASSRDTPWQMWRAPFAVRRLSRVSFDAGWKPMKSAGEASLRAARYSAHRRPGAVGEHDDVLPVPLAAHSDAVAAEGGAVECQRLGDAAAGGEQERQQRPVALLGDGGPGQRVEHAIARIRLERLG